MEGTKNEAIFESFNLKPQHFINEALNVVDELVEGAFDHIHQEASMLLKTEGTERSDVLKLGINCIRVTIQSILDKRLAGWEQYCLHHCFAVPPGFSLPSVNETSSDDVSDEQADAQLDLLKKKLSEAGKECAELDQELQALERKSTMSDQYVSSVNKALELYDRSSAYDMFQVEDTKLERGSANCMPTEEGDEFIDENILAQMDREIEAQRREMSRFPITENLPTGFGTSKKKEQIRRKTTMPFTSVKNKKLKKFSSQPSPALLERLKATSLTSENKVASVPTRKLAPRSKRHQ